MSRCLPPYFLSFAKLLSRRRTAGVVVTCLLIAGVNVALGKPAPEIVPLQPLDDPLELLDPAVARSEAESDRLHAAALFAAGRIFQRKGELAPALRYYQRAARYDAGNLDALRRTIELARKLNRHSEVARYAALLVEHDLSDSLNILRAFAFFREKGDVDGALRLYERALKDGNPDNRQPAWIEIHKLAGQFYLTQENYEKAAAALARVEEVFADPDAYGLDADTLKLLQGDDPAALYRVTAEAYLRTDQFDKAAATFERADEISPDRGRKLLFEARLAQAQKKPDAAIEKLQEYFDAGLTSLNDAPYDLLGELLKEKGEADRLVARLESLSDSDPDNAAVAYYLAEKYLEAERWDDAAALFQKHRGDHPQGRVYRGLAKAYHKLNRPAAFLELIGDLAGRVGSLGVIGDELENFVNDKPFYDAIVSKAKEQMAGDAEAVSFGTRLAVAELAAEAEDWETTEEFFEHAIAHDPEDKAAIFETWGMHLLGAEEYDRAAKLYRRAIDERAAPADRPVFHHYLAGALAMLDQHAAALKAARHAAETSKDSPEFLSRVAWILYRDKKYQEAAKVYEELIERFDGQDSSAVREVLRETRLTLSHLKVLAEKMQAAEELLEEVLDEFPHDIGAKNDLGYLWADRNVHLNRALRMIQTAVKAEPDNAAYRDSYGWILYRLGRHDEAVEQLRRAVADQGDEADGVILDHLADALNAAGNSDEARKTWQRALEAFEKDDDKKMADKVRKKLAAP